MRAIETERGQSVSSAPISPFRLGRLGVCRTRTVSRGVTYRLVPPVLRAVRPGSRWRTTYNGTGTGRRPSGNRGPAGRPFGWATTRCAGGMRPGAPCPFPWARGIVSAAAASETVSAAVAPTPAVGRTPRARTANRFCGGHCRVRPYFRGQFAGWPTSPWQPHRA